MRADYEWDTKSRMDDLGASLFLNHSWIVLQDSHQNWV